MSGMFLSGPFLQRFVDQDFISTTADHLFHTSRRASQSDAQVGVLLRRKCEIELAVEPP